MIVYLCLIHLYMNMVIFFLHGYGIFLTAEILKENERFRNVNIWNRKHPLKIREGMSYIPDIICTTLDGKQMYIEYECGNPVFTES